MEWFILKDHSVEDLINPFNAFSIEVNRWFRFAKIIDTNYEPTSDDILIINAHNNLDLSKFKIPDSVKIISIIHEIDKNSTSLLNKSSHVIFMNKYQEMFAKVYLGFDKPSTICPRFPLKQFNVEFEKEDVFYVGGLIRSNSIQTLHEKIDKLNLKLPRNIKFKCEFVTLNETCELYVADFTKRISEIPYLINKVSVNLRNKQSYEKMLFNIQCSKYAILWDDGPELTDFHARLLNKDASILESKISDSAMLSHIQSAKCDFMIDNKVKFQAYLNNENNFTYRDFASKLSTIISNI